jgi:hypothetical protein
MDSLSFFPERDGDVMRLEELTASSSGWSRVIKASMTSPGGYFSALPQQFLEIYDVV